MTPAELIDLVANTIRGTNADVARRLQISPKTLSHWRTGDGPIPDQHVIELAKLADLDEATTLVEVTAAQVRPTQPPAVRATWTEAARRLQTRTVIPSPPRVSTADNVYNVKGFQPQHLPLAA